jgi:hypothetical protein
MMDWMSPGPGPLDLVTPLAQGVQAGQRQQEITNMAQYRKGELQQHAAETDIMRQRLGLEEKQMDFQHSMWDSQADMRTAQLELVQSQSKLQASSAQNVADDHTILGDGMTTLDQAAAKGDWNGVLNALTPDFKTPQAMQTYEQHRNSLLTTVAGKAAVDVQNAVLGGKIQQYQNTQELIKGVNAIPGASYDQYFTTAPDRTPVERAPGLAAKAIQENIIAMEKAKAENSAAFYGAIIKGKTATSVAGTRAAASMSNNTAINNGEGGTSEVGGETAAPVTPQQQAAQNINAALFGAPAARGP